MTLLTWPQGCLHGYGSVDARCLAFADVRQLALEHPRTKGMDGSWESQGTGLLPGGMPANDGRHWHTPASRATAAAAQPQVLDPCMRCMKDVCCSGRGAVGGSRY